MNEAQPGRTEIAGWLEAVAEGRADRDAADRNDGPSEWKAGRSRTTGLTNG
ncbi:hypothetical protein [Kitasatospora griseola]|uniref:hypothetical protein n=1 Tax=Kitasatospora griseola TaxID=2064 RepID=UPI00382C2039